MSAKIEKLTAEEQKLQEHLKKVKAQIKKERDAENKKKAEERNKWLLILASGIVKKVKANPVLAGSITDIAQEALSESDYKKVYEGLKSEGLVSDNI
ncbi:hypothetical protein JCM30760_27100 [Thiomicrorhabdus hydrogeniphila]